MTHYKDNIKKAFIFILLASVSTSLMAMFVKLAAPHTNTAMTVFSRFFVSVVYLGIILTIRRLKGHVILFHTKHLKWHLIRALIALTAMSLFYYSLRYIPMVDAVVLMRTNPFWVVILGAVLAVGARLLSWKRSRISVGAWRAMSAKKLSRSDSSIRKSKFRIPNSLKHFLAVFVGFIGVLLVLEPGMALFCPESLMALMGGLGAAVSFMILRAIGKQDHPYTTMSYYFPLAFLLSGLVALFHWKTPDIRTLFLLLGVGVFGTLYQEFVMRASQYISARVTSSLLYMSIIFSGLLGLLIFGEMPSVLDFVGIVFICIGGIMTVLVNGHAKNVE